MGSPGSAPIESTHAGSVDGPADDALRAEGLSKRYGDRLALREVSFTAARGELVAIIGPNGAGKTTLLQILAGSLKPSGGSVSLDPSEIGWVPQQAALYNKLSVAENLRLFARLEGKTAAEVKGSDGVVARMLSQTGLAERADDEVGSLSGGNRQRVNIAIGVLSEPRVLLLDEPSSSLDPRQRNVLWEFVRELAAAGTTVIFSTHNVSEADRYADRVLVLADGDLLFAGTTDELRVRADCGPDERDFEAAFVQFLKAEGH